MNSLRKRRRRRRLSPLPIEVGLGEEGGGQGGEGGGQGGEGGGQEGWQGGEDGERVLVAVEEGKVGELYREQTAQPQGMLPDSSLSLSSPPSPPSLLPQLPLSSPSSSPGC